MRLARARAHAQCPSHVRHSTGTKYKLISAPSYEARVLANIGKSGERGSRDNELDKPNGVAVGREGQIYVADRGNHRVQILNADLTYKGICYFPDRVGRTDIYPEKIAINSVGNVYVTDSKNTCVFVFDQSAQFLFHFGKKANSRDRGSLSSPNKEDDVYVSESNVSVSIFDKEGCFVKAFGNDLIYRDIKAMHIDHRGNLYVCKGKDNRVRVFKGILTLSQVETEKNQTT